MKARRIVWPARGRADVCEFDIPVIQPGRVLVETAWSAVSPGTERAWLMAMPNTPGTFPQYPGYSAAGRVLEVGAGVTRIRPGDRVVGGGHSSHAVLAQASVVPIEDLDTSLLDGSLSGIAVMALQGVRKARIELGESVLVMGQGLMGQFAAQFAKLAGGVPVSVMDPDQARLRLAMELGADRAYSPEAGRCNANVVIEATGSAQAIKQAMAEAAQRGRVVALGCARELVDGIDFYHQVHRKGLTIIGAHASVRPGHDSSPGYWSQHDDHRTFLALLKRGRLRVAPLISERIEIDRVPEFYHRLIQGEAVMGAVFAWSRHAETYARRGETEPALRKPDTCY